MTKASLRQDMLARRLSISEQELKRRNDLVIEQLISLPEIQNARSLMGYLPMKEKKELDFTSLLLQESSRKNISVPFMFPDLSLRPAVLTPETPLVTKKWNIQEPANPVFTAVSPDVILCPGICADERGFRLGYGKGFYDRFLALRHGIFIFPVLDDFVIPEIPADSFDIPVHIIVTENRILRTSPRLAH